MCGLYYYSKEELGGKVLRKLSAKKKKKKSLMTDRCLEWGDYLMRNVGWGKVFLLVDALLEHSHLTHHFDLDISEMLNSLEMKVLCFIFKCYSVFDVDILVAWTFKNA